jgi:serine/threonine protein kinase
MNTGQFDEESVFHAARQIADSAERNAYLTRSCPDARDRRRVEAMLAVHERDRSFLQSPVQAVPFATRGGEVSERPGALVGPYKLLEQIGEGGFGVVFMAEQIKPVRRKVAVKVIKPGMDTRHVIARFEAERQALALMEHENIARVLDAGATETGRPYFVMELVHGVPITEYCDKNELPPRERLTLYLDVCRAVQHAHHKGIIHRDLKPSNVLITLHDGKPVVKVIDFGVAKATGQQLLTDKTLFTNFTQMIGTPLYMSPEQAEMSGLDVDTRSDVYALGVLLYELLTGTTPFDRDRLRLAAYDEVRRIIREEEPPKPSTRLSSLGMTLPGISAQRRTEPQKLSQLLRGDLDWIVMKALAKDRTDRYESANALLREIQRYLANEPVEARPPSPRDRVSKWIRRHKSAVRTTAAVLIGSTIIAGALLWQERANTLAALVQVQHAYQAVDQEKKTSEAERARAEENLKKAREAVDQMLTRVAEGMRDQPHMEKIRRALLEDALGFYQGFLQENSTDPLIRHETGLAYLRIASTRDQLGQYEDSRKAYHRGVGLFEKLRTEFPEEPQYRWSLSVALHQLGVLLKNNLGDMLAAMGMFERVFELRDRLVSEFPTRADYRAGLAHIHLDQSFAFRYRGSTRDSIEHLHRSLEIYQQLSTEQPESHWLRADIANGLQWLAYQMQLLGKFDEAEKYYKESVLVTQNLTSKYPHVPAYHARLLHVQDYVGRFLIGRGRIPEAVEAFRNGIEAGEKLAADFPGYPEHRRRLAATNASLAKALFTSGNAEEADRAFDRSIALGVGLAADFPSSSDFGSRSSSRYFQRGEVLHSMGRLAEAEEAYRRAVEDYEKLVARVGAGSGDLVRVCRSVAWGDYHRGWALSDLGRDGEASGLYTKALVGFEQVLGDRIGEQYFVDFLTLCPDQNFWDPTRAAALMEQQLVQNPDDFIPHRVLGIARYRSGAWNDAIDSLKRSVALRSGTDGVSGFFLAMSYWQLDEKDEAARWYEKDIEWMKQNPLGHPTPQKILREAERLLHPKSNP